MAGEKHPCFGRKLTEEQKENIRIKHIGIKVSEETKKKMSESHKGKNSGKDNVCSKPVICIDLCIYFDSCAEAAKFTVLSPTTV